ncbi:MAG: FAD-dependent oxidoreductase, partial [Lacipirellulaceae bacterium]
DWQVELENGETRRYRGVVIANGHNWDPRWPDEREQYGSEFTGEHLHSSEYKTPDVIRGKRVLVVGGGNSGCELAVEAAIHADRALLSTRRRYPVLPKFFRGKPIDQCHELLHWLRFPLWARRLAARGVMHLTLGPSTRTGVPTPDHRLFETHPVINSQIHHHVGHGDLQLKPDIRGFEGQQVEFADGTIEEIDLIIYATGFRVSFPFVDEQHLNWSNGAPELFLNIFHPQRDDLFCIGLIQPDSGQWGLVDYQSQLVAKYIQARQQESTRYARFQELKKVSQPQDYGVKFKNSPRHRLEVEHYGYRKRLKKLIKSL